MTEKIIYRVSGTVATITINNPEKLNCIGMDMLRDLAEILTEIENGKDLKILLIRSAGDRAFSTGGNLKEFTALDREGITEWIGLGNELFNRIERLSIPTIAVINGFAMGGGLELALSCDFRIATTKSVFGMPEVHHGWVPGWGGLTRIRRLTGEARAKEIILLGQPFDAAKANEYGLLTTVAEPDVLEETIETLKQQLQTADPFVFRMAKNAIADQQRTTVGNDLIYDILASQYSNQYVGKKK